MINAKELRIGNYVMVNYNGHSMPVLVESIKNIIDEDYYLCKYPIVCGDDVIRANTRICVGIPLSEEVLEATELEETDFYLIGYTFAYQFCLCYVGDNTWALRFDSPNANKNCVSYGIKYLHQLQNLYYALTGNELKIDAEKLKMAMQ